MTTVNPFDILVASDVADERARQDTKWGEQNHPDGTGPDSRPLRAEAGFNFLQGNVPAGLLAEAFKAATDRHAKSKTLTFADILLEEVFEALAEDDSQKLRTELVQVAAVATQWVEAIDRRLMDEVHAERAERRG